jgi:hypothetical protein
VEELGEYKSRENVRSQIRRKRITIWNNQHGRYDGTNDIIGKPAMLSELMRTTNWRIETREMNLDLVDFSEDEEEDRADLERYEEQAALRNAEDDSDWDEGDYSTGEDDYDDDEGGLMMTGRWEEGVLSMEEDWYEGLIAGEVEQ